MPPADPEQDPVEAIRRLYYAASRGTIARDLMRAIRLFRELPSEAARERAAVYMDGLSQMRSEWQVTAPADRPDGHASGRPRSAGSRSRRER
jgi:hypothetical protein